MGERELTDSFSSFFLRVSSRFSVLQPESGLVTAAQKLQRKAIEAWYEKDIKKAYAA